MVKSSIPGTDTYPYKAYLEKLLPYQPMTLKTQMKACSLWVKDTASYMEDQKFNPTVQTKNAFPIALLNDVPQPVNMQCR